MPYSLRLKEAWNWGGLTFRQLLARTWKKINENEILTRASAVSFYAMLALVPMLALILAILVQFLPDLSRQGGTSTGIGNMTVDAARIELAAGAARGGVQGRRRADHADAAEPPFGLLSIGLLIALWTTSSLFLEIIAAMNRVYGVVETRSFVRLRLTGIVMTLIQAAILLGALVAIVAGPELLQKMGLPGKLGGGGDASSSGSSCC